MKKFVVGTKYRVDGVQWVCVDRYTNDKGETIVGFVELAEFRQDLKDEFFTPYHEARKFGFACHEEMKVRVFVENERATQCDDTDDIEDYDFDAARTCGVIDLATEYAKAVARGDRFWAKCARERKQMGRCEVVTDVRINVGRESSTNRGQDSGDDENAPRSITLEEAIAKRAECLAKGDYKIQKDEPTASKPQKKIVIKSSPIFCCEQPDHKKGQPVVQTKSQVCGEKTVPHQMGSRLKKRSFFAWVASLVGSSSGYSHLRSKRIEGKRC